MRVRLVPGRATFLTRLARSGIDELVLPADVPDINDYIARAVRSGFPEFAFERRPARATGRWLASYLDDLVTRDAAALNRQNDPAKLRRCLQVLALNTAGMPTDATLHRGAGVNAKTAAAYEQLLVNVYVLSLVPAWTSNRLARLTQAGVVRPRRPGVRRAAVHDVVVSTALRLANDGERQRYVTCVAQTSTLWISPSDIGPPSRGRAFAAAGAGSGS